MKLNLHLAHMFYRVVQAQGFSRAAETLHISQSAVSKGVKELEHQLGLALVDRHGKARNGLHLTQAGQSLYSHLQGVFALAHAALDAVQAHSELRQGTLAIGASTTVAGYWLADLLARYSHTHPHIVVRTVVGNTHAIRQALIECQVDMAIVEGEVQHPDIVTTVWREEPLVVVGSAQLVRDLSTLPAPSTATSAAALRTWLTEQPWLVREPGSGTLDVTLKLLRKYDIHPVKRMELGSNEGIARAAAYGLGLALLPQCLVQDLLTLGRLMIIPLGGQASGDVALRRPLYRLHLARRPSSPATQAFFALLNAAR